MIFNAVSRVISSLLAAVWTILGRAAEDSKLSTRVNNAKFKHFDV